MTDVTQPAPAQAARKTSVVYQRNKKTSAAVVIADKAADRTITIGGLVVILAVFTIMVFLVWVCLPLLRGGTVDARTQYALPDAGRAYVAAQTDEHQTIAIDLAADGKLSAFHVATGRPLSAPDFDLGGQSATAFGKTLKGSDIIFGFADGTVRVGTLNLSQTVIPTDQAPATSAMEKLDERDFATADAIYSVIPGQFRRTAVSVAVDEPQQIAPPGTAIIKVDYRVGGTAERPLKTFVTLDAAGKIRLSQLDQTVNMMTGETETVVNTSEIPAAIDTTNVVKLLLNTDGTRVLIAEKDGTVLRFNTRNFAAPILSETFRTLPDGKELTALSYLNGEQSLVVGGSDGSVAIWFGVDCTAPVTPQQGGQDDATFAKRMADYEAAKKKYRQPPSCAGRDLADSQDKIFFTKAHGDFEAMPAAVTDIRVSQRTRMFTTTDAGGHVWLRHATSERTLLQLPDTPDKTGLAATIFAPRDNGVIGIGKNGQAAVWTINVPHPETTLQSLFGKVWYEGYAEPDYVWQSTSGQDSFEPKLSLIPLIFGTLKAAIYSLLIAVPIALAAAIYTSEFMHWKVRAVVKPIMELMATLPSVVVGFVAALVLSPIVENWIAAVVIAFVVIPVTIIAFAFLWQLVPKPIAIMLDGVPKLCLYFVAVAFSIWASVQIGPAFESAFFGGDFKAWTGGAGSGQPFLFIILIPLSALLVFLGARAMAGGYREWLRSQNDMTQGLLELGRWTALIAVTLGVAWTLASLLSSVGYDVRGGFVDTYVQRNTLIAAFAISFAEIPIIYTIAEDAMNTVPEHLRSGSLACGASRWQTAKWVVVPTAGSGIFSAIMIGLGRAVGETMIVVMSTGNTPVTDINLFNGLRALSANINVELPEAVRDSTLYRTLFLCALTLFIMTFVINTIAEMVRQRFRKRAAQL
jgi:phosphate transport system permease protein